MQSTSNEPELGVWKQIAPLLDEALNSLGEKEHVAVVLRFFDDKELKQVGAAMAVRGSRRTTYRRRHCVRPRI